jgi:hypothetical protein
MQGHGQRLFARQIWNAAAGRLDGWTAGRRFGFRMSSHRSPNLCRFSLQSLRIFLPHSRKHYRLRGL